MDRLLQLYPDVVRLDVLVNTEEELLLLLDSHHGKFEKQNLGFIDNHNLKTNITELRPSDVVRLVRPLGLKLYSTDIESITKITGGCSIHIHPHCLIHFGTFKIKYREYAKEG